MGKVKTKKDNNEAVIRCRIRQNEKFLQAQVEKDNLYQEIRKREKNIQQILKRFNVHMATLPPSISNNANVQRICQKFNQMSKTYASHNPMNSN